MSAFPILAVQKISMCLSHRRTVGSQGCGCSPIKRDHELGSERCEAVCLISTGDADVRREGLSSTRGTEVRRLWSTCYLARYAGQLRAKG